MKSQIEFAKDEIVDVVKKEYWSQMINTFEGNISIKIGNVILITPSQVPKDIMTPDKIIELDEEGNVIYAAPGMVPSVETMMHVKLYHLRKDIHSIVHNHSMYATAFAMNGEPIRSDSHFELNLLFGQVPIVPYGTSGTEKIYEHFGEYIGNYHGLLLANHGLVTFGSTLEMAFSYAEGIEKIAHTIFVSRLLGTENKLPEEELINLRNRGDLKRNQEIANSK